MLCKTTTASCDSQDNGVIKQPIEQSGGEDGMTEEAAPFGEAAV